MNPGLSLVGGRGVETPTLVGVPLTSDELTWRLAPRELPPFDQAGVAFDPAAHRYTLEGTPVVNTTSVLKAHKISANWDRVDPEVLDRKRDLGLAVHAATHYEDEGTLDPTYYLQAPTVEPFADAWRKFRVDLLFEPWLLETRLVHLLLRYAGTVDRFGVLWALGSIPSVVDIKTGDPDDAGAGPQTGAYEQLIRANLPEILAHLAAARPGCCKWSAEDLARLPWTRYSVRLFNDGTYKLHTYTNPRDLQRFNWALSLEASAHPSWKDRL